MEIEYNKIDKNIVIIDIRSSENYNLFHVNGSINIPKIKLLNDYKKYLDKLSKYYIICDTGELSLICTKILNALDYNCISIKGGIKNVKSKGNV